MRLKVLKSNYPINDFANNLLAKTKIILKPPASFLNKTTNSQQNKHANGCFLSGSYCISQKSSTFDKTKNKPAQWTLNTILSDSGGNWHHSCRFGFFTSSATSSIFRYITLCDIVGKWCARTWQMHSRKKRKKKSYK